MDTSKLPAELDRMVNDLSGGVYYTAGASAGLEGGAQANVTFGVTTTTMDQWEGATWISEELSVHGEVCADVCVGIVAADNYSTENSVDTFGVSIGGGAEYGAGVDIVTYNGWITTNCSTDENSNEYGC